MVPMIRAKGFHKMVPAQPSGNAVPKMKWFALSTPKSANPSVSHPAVAATSRASAVLGLMAEGLSNSQISDKLYLSSGAVSKHVAAVFMKLGFTPDDENRRVRAVLQWLRHTST